MKKMKKVISLVLALACVMGALLIPSAATGSAGVSSAAADADAAGTYTKKVVSVFYDNSGSMITGTPNSTRHDYAKYAMQVLAAMLGEEDELILTPMNTEQGSAVKDGSYSYEVDLSAANRDAAVRDMLANSFLSDDPFGGTPFNPINVVLQQLIDRGMKEQNGASFDTDNTEYWMFVMTDGEFDGMNVASVESKFAEYTQKYSNFHMVYLGFGSGAVDMSSPVNSDLQAANNYSAHHSADIENLIATMQKIANQISGRYTAEPALYTQSGNQITVHLDGLNFAIHNLSVLMQNAEASLLSATYKGQTLQIGQSCTIVPADKLKKEGFDNGYSAVVKPSSGLMVGGDIVLTFSAPVGEISLMVEPALKLRTVVERREGSSWVPTDRLYINSFMKEGNEIRVGYEVYEEGSGRIVDLNALFDPIEESVSYAGKVYQPGDAVPLVKGNNEIIINVSVMNGTYQLYDSYSCIVWANPTDYRIEGVAKSTDGGKGIAYDLEFTVYVDNKPLSAAELADYTWSVQGTDDFGNAIPLSPTVDGNGKIKASVNLSTLPAGEATFKAQVVSSDGFIRESTVQLTVTASLKLHMTVERREGSGWVETDRQYINRYMKPGDEIRVTYRVYDEENQAYVNVADVLGPVTETVSYAGADYRPGEAIPLTAGTHEIETTVRSNDGNYVLYGTFQCVVLANVTDFRIEGKEEILDGGFGLRRAVTFVVYANNTPLTAAELALYSWQVTGTDATGSPLTLQPAVQADGSILVPLDLSTLAYGTIRLQAAATDPDGFARDAELLIPHESKTVEALVVGNDHISKTQYQLTQNEEGFAFMLQVTSGSVTTPLDPSAYTYRVTVKGKDVTKYCTVDGINVVFTPTKQSLGELAGSLGDLEVLFTASITAYPSFTDDVSATLTVSSTTYDVIVSVDGDGVNPFRVKDDELYIYISAVRDGIPLTASELLAAQESGELELQVKGGFLRNRFGFFKTTTSVEDHNGMPALRISPNPDKAWLAYCLTGMVAFPGAREVSASYHGETASDGYEIFNPGAMAYVIRILIYFLILHIIMLIVGYRRINRFAPGRYFRVVITLSDRKVIRQANIGRPKDVNRTFFSRILWKRLLIPCVYWFRGTQTMELEGGSVVLTATGMRVPNARVKYNTRSAGAFVAAMKTGEYEDVAKIQARLRNGQYNGQELKNMSIDFEERPLFKTAEQGGRTPQKRQSDAFRNLSDFRNPICLRKTGNPNSMSYTFIFFIPD